MKIIENSEKIRIYKEVVEAYPLEETEESHLNFTCDSYEIRTKFLQNTYLYRQCCTNFLRNSAWMD